MNTNKTAIVLFSDDFRIEDNPALYWATEYYDKVVLLYIYNESYLGRPIGSASKAFLHCVLNSFKSLLATKYQANLVIESGEYLEVIKKITDQFKIDAIYYNTSYTLKQMQCEKAIRSKFGELDIKAFKAKLLFNPCEIKPSSGGDFTESSPHLQKHAYKMCI